MKQLKADDFKKYYFISNPRFSEANENYIFHAAKVNNAEGYNNNIWLSKGGEKPFQLTSGENDKFILWEDDNSILFSAKRKEEKNKEHTTIYKISINGGEAKEIFTLPFSVSSMEKISDNTYIVLATVDMDKEDFSIDKKEEKDEWEADVQEISELPFWSNGAGFTANKRTQMFLYEPDEKNKITLISEKQIDISKAKYHKEIKIIYYIGNDFKKVAKTADNIYSYNIETKETKTILSEKLRMYTFDFYKDNIVFPASEMKNHGLNENAKIFQFSLKDNTLKIIAEPDRGICSTVGTDSNLGGGGTFKAADDNLYFTMVTEYSGRLCELSLTTGKTKYLSDVGDSVNGFDINLRTLNIVTTMFKGLDLAEIYSLKKDAGTWEKVTEFNTEFHKNHNRSAVEYYKFTDVNGFEIDGWAMKPTDYEEGKTYPAILHIHGGPKTVLGEIYHHEMQLWANNGYFVLFCNPRGSDGKGDAFSDIRGKYGTVDYDDIMQFLDIMIEKYSDIDKERVGVTGGSYGGFMTNWIVGHTNRFKAAVTQRSISNWISKTYMSDIGYYFNVDQVLAENWETSSFDVEKLWNSSPLKYAHNAKTPTLIIHSDEDYRCTVPEGYQMFSALQLAGVETKMCVFHGETHELSRSGKPKNRLRRLNEILGWMDLYLK